MDSIRSFLATLAASFLIAGCAGPTSAPVDPASLGVAQAAALIRSGQLTSTALTQAVLGDIAKRQDMKTMVYVDAAGALDKARRRDAEVRAGARLGPLHGVPFVVKDNIHVAGWPNAAGTSSLKAFVPTEDAPVVQRLRAAGAVIVGKAAMTELALGSSGKNWNFGDVGNAYDPARFAGGSSSGTGAAVGARLVPAGLGTDTAGSIHIPSSFNGTVGYRPSVGRYPTNGVTPISATLDTVGIIARSVADIALVDSVLAGEPQAALPAVSAPTLRLGVPRNYFYADLDPETARVTELALAKLRRAGVELIDVELADIETLNQKASFNISRFEPKRDIAAYLKANGIDLTIEQLANAIADPGVKALWINAILGPGGVSEQTYREALDTRTRMIALYKETFARHRLDALIYPTTPMPAQSLQSGPMYTLNGKQQVMHLIYIRNTFPGATADLPGLSMPSGSDARGLPIGIKLDAPTGNDRRLLAIGSAVEAILGSIAPPPRP